MTALGMSDREADFCEKLGRGLFKHILPKINGDGGLAVLFSDNPASRPNTPVNIIIGMFILKELFN